MTIHIGETTVISVVFENKTVHDSIDHHNTIAALKDLPAEECYFQNCSKKNREYNNNKINGNNNRGTIDFFRQNCCNNTPKNYNKYSSIRGRNKSINCTIPVNQQRDSWKKTNLHLVLYFTRTFYIFLHQTPPPPFFSPKKTNKDNDSFNKKT